MKYVITEVETKLQKNDYVDEHGNKYYTSEIVSQNGYICEDFDQAKAKFIEVITAKKPGMNSDGKYEPLRQYCEDVECEEGWEELIILNNISNFLSGMPIGDKTPTLAFGFEGVLLNCNDEKFYFEMDGEELNTNALRMNNSDQNYYLEYTLYGDYYIEPEKSVRVLMTRIDQ